MIVARVTVALGLLIYSSQAYATCPGAEMSGTDISTLLTNNYACVLPLSPSGSNELHQAGGNLVEYAKGPSDAVDPSHTVGTWNVSGTTTGSVNYTYAAGGSYSYQICAGSTSPYTFSAGSSNMSVVVQGTHC